MLQLQSPKAPFNSVTDLKNSSIRSRRQDPSGFRNARMEQQMKSYYRCVHCHSSLHSLNSNKPSIFTNKYWFRYTLFGRAMDWRHLKFSKHLELQDALAKIHTSLILLAREITYTKQWSWMEKQWKKWWNQQKHRHCSTCSQFWLKQLKPRVFVTEELQSLGNSPWRKIQDNQ